MRVPGTVTSLAASWNNIIISWSKERDGHQIFHINHLDLVRCEALIRWEAFAKPDLDRVTGSSHCTVSSLFMPCQRQGLRIMIMSDSPFVQNVSVHCYPNTY